MTCGERFLSNDYLELLTDYRLSPELLEIVEGLLDFCYFRIDNGLAVVSVSREQVPPLTLADYPYQYVPNLYGLMQQEPASAAGRGFDPNPLLASGILQVQRQPLALQGEGVILAFLDTGIAYDNPVFRRPDGSSRILAIWDMTVQEGTPPEGFLFGSEYTRNTIDEALRSEDPRSIVPSYDTNGHGTALASVAAGSILEEGVLYNGAAPQADILVVKLREANSFLKDYYLTAEGVPAYSAVDIAMALKYLDGFAESFRRPVVFCLGFGSSLGDHTDDDLLSAYLQRLAGKRSRAVVICCGNEGSSAHHYSDSFGLITSGGRNTGAFSMAGRPEGEASVDVEIRVESAAKGFVAELWGSVPNEFSVSVRTPGGESTGNTGFRPGTHQVYNFVYDRTRLTIDYVSMGQGLGDSLVFLRFENPTPGIWTLRVTGERVYTEGEFNIWLPQTEFVGGEVYFLKPDPYVTLTEPSAVEGALSVSTYDSENGSFYFRSGRGYTRDRRIKPDLAAPGVEISAVTGMLSGRPVVSRLTGSSMAAALAAGGAALLMQWAVLEENALYVRGMDIRNYMIQGARRDSSLIYPNKQWGYGTLDVDGVFARMAGL